MKMLLPSLLVCVISMMAGCSVNDEEYVDLRPRVDDFMYVNGIFEGEWSVNKQVVDTARMVISENGEIEVRLPEDYLLGLCFPYGNENNKSSNMTNLIEVYPLGYSEQSQYMAMNSNTQKDKDAKVYFNTCSFQATIGDELCSIDLLSYENATAVLQNATGQWTLGIPIDAFLIKNQQTGRGTKRELSIPVTLYYNTTKRIR